MNSLLLLDDLIQQKKSFLCVGLDPDPEKIPKPWSTSLEGIQEYLINILNSTLPYSVACKPNLAFFEVWGSKGWDLLNTIVGQIPPDIFVIADAKRGDIGNSSTQYAKAILNLTPVNAITVSPYMGFDSINPFLQFPNKWTFVLALTSNIGAEDFQLQKLVSGKFLFEEVIIKCQNWAKEAPGVLGFVVGATHPEHMELVRKHAPDTYVLCPGVGTQGGDLQEVIKHLAPRVLINVGRHLLYSEPNEDPFKAANIKAASIQAEMAKWF